MSIVSRNTFLTLDDDDGEIKEEESFIKKLVYIQKADVEWYTIEEKKCFAKFRYLVKPLTDWWNKKLTDFTMKGVKKDASDEIKKVESPKQFAESPGGVVTSQFGYSAQQKQEMEFQAFQNEDQLSTTSGRLPWLRHRCSSSR